MSKQTKKKKVTVAATVSGGAPPCQYRTEILTASKEGLVEFVRELKRTQLRHMTPFEAFARARKKARKEVSEALYEKAVNLGLEEWRARQDETVKKAAQKAKAARVKAAEEDEEDGDGNFRARLALTVEGIDRSPLLAATFASVKFYVGDLNRDLNQARVDAYAADMEKGKWWFTPDPIVVTEEGAIINGQHRLLAIEKVLERNEALKVAPQFSVVWGVDKRAALLRDEARRTSTDRRDIAIRYAQSQSKG